MAKMKCAPGCRWGERCAEQIRVGDYGCTANIRWELGATLLGTVEDSVEGFALSSEGLVKTGEVAEGYRVVYQSPQSLPESLE